MEIPSLVQSEPNSSSPLTSRSSSLPIETYKQFRRKTLQFYQRSKVKDHGNCLLVTAGAQELNFYLLNVASRINWLHRGSHTSKVTSPLPYGHVIWPCGVCVFSRFLPWSKRMHTSVCLTDQYVPQHFCTMLVSSPPPVC